MYVGLWSRVQGLEREDLTRALERRSVVQGTLMRTTIHLVSAADYWPLALAVRQARQPAEAEQRFRRLLAAQPANGVARIGLVETLLARRAYAEAAAEARLEPESSPVRAAAAAADAGRD